MWTRFVDWLCWKIVESFPARSKTVYIEDEPYLLRFYIKRNGVFPGVYLHHFFMGDMDRDLHDHPWTLSGSLILTGGYVEERLVDPDTWIRMTRDANEPRQSARSTPAGIVVRRQLGPGSLNIIRGTDFHRVDLVGDSAWTVFVSGEKTKDWGFLIRDTRKIIPHREYLAEKGRPLQDEDEWAND